jgi:hypothetical protein
MNDERALYYRSIFRAALFMGGASVSYVAWYNWCNCYCDLFLATKLWIRVFRCRTQGRSGIIQIRSVSGSLIYRSIRGGYRYQGRVIAVAWTVNFILTGLRGDSYYLLCTIGVLLNSAGYVVSGAMSCLSRFTLCYLFRGLILSSIDFYPPKCISSINIGILWWYVNLYIMIVKYDKLFKYVIICTTLV